MSPILVLLIDFNSAAEKTFTKLPKDVRIRIERFLRERVARQDNPRRYGKALTGPIWSGHWSYRVDDYRIICLLKDRTVHIVDVGHRSKIFRRRWR
jgi:mRNA interferase RelE/StbE